MTKESQEALDRARARFADTTKIEVSYGEIDLLIHYFVLDFQDAMVLEKGKRKKPATKAWESFLAMETEKQYKFVIQSALRQHINKKIQQYSIHE